MPGQLIPLETIIDLKRGSLGFIEKSNGLPFEIKRVYYIYDLSQDMKERGFHAHIELEQLFIVLSGEATVYLDDGLKKEEFNLKNPSKALYIPKLTWRTFGNFQNNTIILVLASKAYDEKDYIRDYEAFKKIQKI